MGSAGPKSEAFVLRWNDFQSNIATTFQDLREEEDFFDVTLACEDLQIQAHKVILSACSPYFRKLLKCNTGHNRHPILIMPPTVSFQEMSNVVDFMYHGEVSVNQDQLTHFLEVATQLKVKGLTEEKAQNRPAMHKPMPKLPPGVQATKTMRRPSDTEMNKRPRMDSGRPGGANMPRRVEQGPDDEEEEDITEIRQTEGDDAMEFGYGDYGNYSSYQEMGGNQQSASESTTQSTGSTLMGLICPQCDELCRGVNALKQHMAVAHGVTEQSGVQGSGSGGAPFRLPHQTQTGHSHIQQHQPMQEMPSTCQICDKSFKSLKTMLSHQRRIHKQPAPKQGYQRKPGRPSKKMMMHSSTVDHEENYDPQYGNQEGYHGYNQNQPGNFSQHYQSQNDVNQGKQIQSSSDIPGRPIGQVSPAPRPQQPGMHHAPSSLGIHSVPTSGGPTPPLEIKQEPLEASQQEEVMATPTPPPMVQTSTSAQRPQAPKQQVNSQPPYPIPHGGARRPTLAPSQSRTRQPSSASSSEHIQKLGLKFGGQISITSTGTSSGNAGGRKGLGGLEGVSITKLKGDVPVGSPVSIRDATRPSTSQPQTTVTNTRQPQQDQQVEVKSEPLESYDANQSIDQDGEDGGYYEQYADQFDDGTIPDGEDNQFGDGEEFEEMDGEDLEEEEYMEGQVDGSAPRGASYGSYDDDYDEYEGNEQYQKQNH